MSAVELLADLFCRGVELRPDGSELHVSAPIDALTAADKEVITELKPELLELLELLSDPEALETVAWAARAGLDPESALIGDRWARAVMAGADLPPLPKLPREEVCRRLEEWESRQRRASDETPGPRGSQ
jgi:hypothetical protein